MSANAETETKTVEPESDAQESVNSQKGYVFYQVHEPNPLYESIVVSGIRLEYLKLAVIVVLIMVIVWYLFSRMKANDNATPAVTERLNTVKHVNGSNVKDTTRNDEDEHFAPYASWLVPDIYRSDPAHDENISNNSHFGQYAPYDLQYLQPNNPDIPSSKISNKNRERLVTYNQHDYDTDEVAGEYNVPEQQLEAEAGLLFGLTNHEDVPVSNVGPL